ncbi:thiamine-phosphate kinase [Bdellovibrio sp. GT3]|uniref:thiamine-phosphate kinase n=1 Tax=Bdellovibrio sp. GT3 TaxID=3136282 RepID=UPI0030F33921
MQNTPKEWQVLKNIRNKVQRHNPNTIVPLGDDAFVFKNFPGYSVIAQDMMVEDVHFRLDYSCAFDLGHKALAVNLSDLAAMGADPRFAQVSLAIPKEITETWLDEFYQGMTTLADKFGVEIAGGDLCASPRGVIIDVSVHGSCDKPITRHGTQAGDILLSSGPLGLSTTGLRALNEDRTGDFPEATARHLRPLPRLDLLPQLRQHADKIHALMDCSDGLVNDALILSKKPYGNGHSPHIGGVHLFPDQFPLHDETLRMAHLSKAYEYALWGGEDYELLISVNPENRTLFPEWTEVGQFTESPGVFLIHGDGKEEISTFKGWKHF